MSKQVVSIARDFSDTPGGRFERLGPFSGEAFRQKLVELLDKGSDVEVVLDGVEGYGSSFLEEAFGGLVRLKRWTREDILKRVQVVAKSPEYQMYQHLANQYIDDALNRL